MDKHSSLLRKFINYGEKSFITLGIISSDIRRGTLDIDAGQCFYFRGGSDGNEPLAQSADHLPPVQPDVQVPML
jgi:hypothetical protein